MSNNKTNKMVIDTCLKVLMSSMTLEELIIRAFEQARSNEMLKVDNKLINNKKAHQALSIWLAEQDIQDMQETESAAYCASIKEYLNA